MMALCSCTLGPDYTRPATSASLHQTFMNVDKVETRTSNQHSPINRWWTTIDDPMLPDYIDTLLAQNLDLKQASERVAQSRARLGMQTGGQYPSIGVNASASRTGSPVNGNQQYSNTINVNLESSWELDLFGRINRAVESAQASYEASLYDKEALTHSLIAQLVKQRIAIAVDKKLLKLAQNNAKNRKQTLDIISRRYDLGVASAALSDVLLAEENYSTVKTDINEFERRLANDLYGLDILLGQLPGTTSTMEELFPLSSALPSVQTCMPASLLDRRPDLKANELVLKAANADIGIAISDLYPSLNLSGSIGFSGNSGHNLFTADQFVSSIMGALTNRIFQGGALRANIDLQKAEANELAHAYADAVLVAIQEVESNLQAEQKLAKEIQSLSRSSSALNKAKSIVEDRYQRGLTSLRDVLDTQQREYQIQQNLILRQQAKWNTRVALYLALGGDWLSIDKTTNSKVCL